MGSGAQGCELGECQGTTHSHLGAHEVHDGIEALADDAFADVCTPGNPRPATREDIKALYTSLL